MDILSLFSEWIPSITTAVTVAAGLAAVLPKPSDPTSPAGVAHSVINALAINMGHATNASTVETVNAVVQTVAPQTAPVVIGAERIAAIVADAYLAGHKTGQGAQAARAVIDALHPQRNDG